MSSDRAAAPHRRWRADALAIWLLLPALAAAAPLVPGPQLIADGIPSFEEHAAAAREEPSAPRFVGWHPLRTEMLVLARSGTRTQLHVLDGPQLKRRALTTGADPVNNAQWEPARGDYLVFSRDHGGDEAYRLFRLQPGSGPALATPVAITPADARVSDFEFLPGRDKAPAGLVYLLEQLDRQVAKAGERVSVTRLMWVDPQQPALARQLGEVRGGRFTSLRVTAGGAIVVTRIQGGRSQLLRFGLDGAEPRLVGAAAKVGDAGDLAIEGDDSGEDGAQLLWQRQAAQGDFRHVQRLDVDSGRRDALLTDIPADLEALAVPRGAGLPLALVHNEAGVSVLRLWQPGGSAPQRIDAALAAGVITNPRWHPSLPLLAFGHASASSPGRIYVYDKSKAVMQVWAGAEGDDAREPTEYTTLRWKSFDGLEISGLHIAPPARFKGPRPVYVSIHGGPASQSRPGYLAKGLYQLVNELGMHVILPNVRGSEGFGKRFVNLDNGRQREDSVRDISALLDLIAGRADMDATKVVVAGGSYGGYMSLAVAVRESARIAGSICRVGIANFVSFLENTESYRRDNRRAEYGDERDPEMRAFLQQISPLTHASAVKKPLFVVHGRNDPRVPYGEAQAMVQAVRAAGTPVWFLTAEDEGHSFTGKGNREFLQQASFEFVRRLVNGQPLQPVQTAAP
ncbi:alpha/beta hydrolase family protein [Roseateles sp.]|uniref:alpha/beta hydrolase family protein n=1 Tax=Roseateles sp. TaxID=1971397 RepID=UPI0039E9C7F6